MHGVIFSAIEFLCVLLLRERCVQMQVLPKRVQSPSLSHFPLRDSTPLSLRGKGLTVSSETSSRMSSLRP